VQIEIVSSLVDEWIFCASIEFVFDEIFDGVDRPVALAFHGHRRQLVELQVGVPDAVAEDQVRKPDFLLAIKSSIKSKCLSFEDKNMLGGQIFLILLMFIFQYY
jgi:hypothetical protein